MNEGVELDAKLDVAVADVFGRRLCAAPAMEGRFEGFHVPNEVVYDRRDVRVKLAGSEHCGCGFGGKSSRLGSIAGEESTILDQQGPSRCVDAGNRLRWP